jgi:hypothetical protein
VSEYFEDPFKHSIASGAADEYEKIVGLALTSARRVLVVWTANAVRSDYVRAEVLLAVAQNKMLAVYRTESAPKFPNAAAEIAESKEALRSILISWRDAP